MKRPDADHLADKICRTWRSSIPAEIWSEALLGLDVGRAEHAWRELRDSEQNAPSIALFRARYVATGAHVRDGHALGCLCGGSGWMLIEQRDEMSTWYAWTRCPDGPKTSFVEPSAEFDQAAAAAAWETFEALRATAETRAELAGAFIAAGQAYSNASRKELF